MFLKCEILGNCCICESIFILKFPSLEYAKAETIDRTQVFPLLGYDANQIIIELFLY